MTDNERRVLEEWRDSCEKIGGTFNTYDMAEMLDDLLNADSNTDVTPQRPAIGEQFWMRGHGEPEWGVWTATPNGPASYDTDGEPWVKTWSDFDCHVADGIWEWMPLEQPEDRTDD